MYGNGSERGPVKRTCLGTVKFSGSVADLADETRHAELPWIPDFHFSFGSGNHRVTSDAFIYAGLKALKALRRPTPNG